MRKVNKNAEREDELLFWPAVAKQIMNRLYALSVYAKILFCLASFLKALLPLQSSKQEDAQ